MHETLHAVFRYALSLTHDHHQAEDLVQEAYRKIMESGKSVSKALLMRSVRNLFIDQYRRMRLISFESFNEETDQIQSMHDDLDRLAQRMDIQSVLAILRPEERELVFLHMVEGWSCQEISDFTKRPRGTILSSIHRAKKKMADYAQADSRLKAVNHEL